MLNYDIYILTAGVIAVGYYLYISSSSKQRSRIWDLLIMGFILWVSPMISDIFSLNEFSSIKISGILIFVYGWVIFIVEKFNEGRSSKTEYNSSFMKYIKKK
ncbi:MAG: hypothetical protein GX154_10240 [Clostridiales bacterium]|nr:hypothetical protein [Clostridiales bacterium]